MFNNILSTTTKSIDPVNEKYSTLIQQKMQENLNHALRIAKVGSWIMDLDSGDIHWSEETYRICGIPADTRPNLDIIFQIIHPDDTELVRKKLNNTLYSGKSYSFDHRIMRPDDIVRIVHEQGELIYDERDSPILLIGTIQDITEQIEATRKLENSEQRYKSLFKYNLHSTYVLDTQGLIQDVNLAAVEMSGYSRSELIGMSFEQIVDEKDLAHSKQILQEVLKGEPQTFHITGVTKHGEKKEILGSSVPIIVNNKIEGIIGAIKDITDQQIIKEKFKNSQEQLLTLIQSIPDFINFKDGDGRWILANSFALSLFQLENINYRGKTDLELATHTEFYHESLSACVVSDEQAWKAKKTIRVEEIVSKPDGSTLIFDVLKTPIFNPDGSRKGLLTVGRDITERKQVEEENKFLAYHDVLTNLPNRRSFDRKLDESILYSEGSKNKLAVLYLDLDRFKYINDTLGHDLGDKLLNDVAERIRNCVPDHGFISRMGGDEFSVILQTIDNVDCSVKVAKEIISSIKDPFRIEGFEFYITTSVGISIYPDNGTDAQTLMKNADVALYRAKELGKNGFQIYNSQMNIGSFKAFTLEKDLHKAIQNEEFELYYQPRVEAHSGKIVAAEALIRWNHPDWGLVSPNEFIPLATETNLIIEIGKWVKENVCKQIKIWQQEGLAVPPISINISPKRFTQKDLVDNIRNILEKYQLAGHCLEIEITEDSLLENEELAIHIINQLQKLGIRISLDDFGTGYSSISYFKKIHVNSIKIDKSYIQDIHSDPVNTNIVNGIIQLAKGIDISIVAEGVETLEQLLFLKGHHCDQIQGYLFSKPVPGIDFKKLLRKGILEPNSNNGKPNLEIKNQRRYFRIDLYFPLLADMTIIKIKGQNIQLGKTEVLIEDIGLGGLRFLSTIRLAVHREIILEFETEILGNLTKFCGAVVWSRDIQEGIFQYGLEFTIIESERTSLSRLLNNLTLHLRKSPLLPNCRFIKMDKINYLKAQLQG